MNTEIKKKVEQCKKGDVQAKNWLYEKYAPILLGICLRYIRSREQAEDILHESFIIIYSKMEQLKKNEAVEGWMKRIIVNQALVYIKKNNTQQEINSFEEGTILEENTSKGLKDIIFEAEITQSDIIEIINNLPIGYRTVFNLYAFEKFKHKEIAKELNISIGTSRSQLQRARCLIQKRIYELIEENKKSKKKDTIYFVSLPSILSNEIEYIDDFVVEKLKDYSVTPVYPRKEFPHKNTESIVNANGQGKWLSFLKGNMMLPLLSIIAIPLISITLYFINKDNSEEKEVLNLKSEVTLTPLKVTHLSDYHDLNLSKYTTLNTSIDSSLYHKEWNNKQNMLTKSSIDSIEVKPKNKSIPNNVSNTLIQDEKTVIQSKKVITRKKVIVRKKVIKAKQD